VQQLVKEAKPQGVMDSRSPIRIKVAGETEFEISIYASA
jgi:hypothetical protein